MAVISPFNEDCIYVKLSEKVKVLQVFLLKASIMNAANHKFCNIFPNFRKKIRYDIDNNCLQASNSHEILCLICYFWKTDTIWNCRLLQIVGGALWVHSEFTVLLHLSERCTCHVWLVDMMKLSLEANLGGVETFSLSLSSFLLLMLRPKW